MPQHQVELTNIDSPFVNVYETGMCPASFVKAGKSWLEFVAIAEQRTRWDAYVLMKTSFIKSPRISTAIIEYPSYENVFFMSKPVSNCVDFGTYSLDEVNALLKAKRIEASMAFKERMRKKHGSVYRYTKSLQYKKAIRYYEGEAARGNILTPREICETFNTNSRYVRIKANSLNTMIYERGHRRAQYKTLTEDERSEIAERHDAGEKTSVLAKEFGVSNSSIYQTIYKAKGIKPDTERKRELIMPPEQQQLMFDMDYAGSTYAEIHEALGGLYSLSTIATRLKANEAMGTMVDRTVGRKDIEEILQADSPFVTLPNTYAGKQGLYILDGKGIIAKLDICALYNVIARRAWAVKGFEVPVEEAEKYLLAIVGARRLKKKFIVSTISNVKRGEYRIIPAAGLGITADVDKLLCKPTVDKHELRLLVEEFDKRGRDALFIAKKFSLRTNF